MTEAATEVAAATAEEPVEAAPEAEAWEDQAVKMGWKPDFKGPNKLDAKTFVERGREILPIVQANNKAMEKALAGSKQEIAELTRTLQEFRAHYTTVEKRAYERAKAELEGRLGAAAEIGDVDGVKAITRQITDLDKQATPDPQQQDPLSDPAFQRAFQAWEQENNWYGTDKTLTIFAKGLGAELAAEGMAPMKQLAEVAKRIRAEFPDKFTNPRRTEAAAVESPSTPRKSGAKGYSDLPPDAKAACDDFVRQKILTREQYVKDFFA